MEKRLQEENKNFLSPQEQALFEQTASFGVTSGFASSERYSPIASYMQNYLEASRNNAAQSKSTNSNNI
jgi:hypothetical protein